MDQLSFGDDSVATQYENLLVPALFEPWAASLVEEFQPWKGRRVLDLATGTGVVANMLAERVGPSGAVTAADISKAMLSQARKRCTKRVQFVECSAQALELDPESVDVVVCQQGFQFFPDKRAAATEIRRVLRTGGIAVVTTWRPVDECQYFGALCDALDDIGEHATADKMRLPFDFMPETELAAAFRSTGFGEVRVERHEQDLFLGGGIEQVVAVAYATPIRPQLLALSAGDQARFRERLAERLRALSPDGVGMGRMAANVLRAVAS